MKILEMLGKESLSYSDLMSRLNFETTGKLNFHLKALAGLIDKNDTGLYRLTDKGKQYFQIYRLNQSILQGETSLNVLASPNEKKAGIHRVGIILCTCMASLCQSIGGNMPPAETIKALTEKLGEIPGVVSVKIFDHLCQVRSQKEITDWIQANYINRIVVAACSPHLHEHLFAEIFRDVFPLGKVEFVNLREQVIWVNDPDRQDNGPVKEKIALLIEAAVARSKLQAEIQEQQFSVEKAVAIIGSGIAGISLAKNLASAGIPKIYLIDSAPTLGGKVIRWSEIAGLNDCCACVLSEEMVDLATWESIEILTFTDIRDIRGVMGNYLLDLNVKMRYVDPERCRACQMCVQVCRNEGNLREDEFEFGLKNRAIIDFPFPYAFPYLPYVNRDDIARCQECKKCEDVCKKRAINFDAQPVERTIKVGAIVFAIGADFNNSYPELNAEWGENVLTAQQFERMLGVDGPTSGKILTRQGTTPERIAILQCAGPMAACNRFCCLTARKYSEAIKKQLGPETDIRIYYDLNRVPPTRLDEVLLSRPSESLSNFLWNDATTYHGVNVKTGSGSQQFLTLYKKYKQNPAGTMIAHGGFPMGLPVSREEGHLVRNLRVDPLDPHEPEQQGPAVWMCNVNGTDVKDIWPPKVNAESLSFSKQRVAYLKEKLGGEPEEDYFDADLVIVNCGLKPTEDIKEFKAILDFNLASDGFIYPESLPSGVFAVGTVTGPKGYRDVLDEVNETFVKILRFINVAKSTESQAAVEINNDRCSLCGLCLKVCPYNALKWSKDK
ncbi:MAG TPA: 4Fe-4S binding protein, partial [Candidatus Lokiarchaeia archaeon]|nr:4Fe-4S binding protein [Candidatus Lokiarchaeia archaeon]